jgi:hypothetical protein
MLPRLPLELIGAGAVVVTLVFVVVVRLAWRRGKSLREP